MRRPVSHRAVGGSPGRKPGGQRGAVEWTAKVLGAAAEPSECPVTERPGRPEKSGGIRGRGELRRAPRPSRHRPCILEKSDQISEPSGPVPCSGIFRGASEPRVNAILSAP